MKLGVAVATKGPVKCVCLCAGLLLYDVCEGVVSVSVQECTWRARTHKCPSRRLPL